MTETALAIRKDTGIIHTYADAQNAAFAMAKSGYFQDSRDQAQALVKILAGQEMGFGPFASMTGIFIIQGRPSVGANLMASAVKGSGRYDYHVKQMTDTVCEITFFEGGKEIGVSKFTIEDARKAGTKNLDKFPRNMLFARAMSNGVRWYCPDAFNGAAVYTPEELGAEVDNDGNVINGSFVESKVEDPESAPQSAPKYEQPEQPYQSSMSLEMALSEKNSEGVAYGDIETSKLTYMLNAMAKIQHSKPAEYTEDHARKCDAIRTILNSRKDI